LQVDHLLVGFPGLRVFSNLQIRVAQDAVCMTIRGMQRNGPLSLLGRPGEVMPSVEDKGQVTLCLAILRMDLQRLAERLLGELKVGRIAIFSCLPAVCIPKSIIL